MKKMLLILTGFASLYGFGQGSPDTIKSKELQEIMIRSWMRRDIDRLPDVQNNVIAAGKKTELINLSSANANVAIKTGRQLFSKVPGVFVYDMDGGGADHYSYTPHQRLIYFSLFQWNIDVTNGFLQCGC